MRKVQFSPWGGEGYMLTLLVTVGLMIAVGCSEGTTRKDVVMQRQCDTAPHFDAIAFR